jgi:hypothetical protein
MGFSIGQATRALRENRGSLNDAVQSLLAPAPNPPELVPPEDIDGLDLAESTWNGGDQRSEAHRREQVVRSGVGVSASLGELAGRTEHSGSGQAPPMPSAGAVWDAVSGRNMVVADDAEVARMVRDMFRSNRISDPALQQYITSMLHLAVREDKLDEANLQAIVDMIREQGVPSEEAQTAVHYIVIKCRPTS